MTSTKPPDDLQDLLAAHALGALDGDDLEMVEHELATNAEARNELARFAATTHLLDRPSGPRPEVWDAIVERIGHRDERRASVTPIASGTSTSARLLHRRVVRTVALAAAIGVLIAAAAWGVEQVDQSSAPAPTLQRAAHAAAQARGAKRVVLTAADGTSATLVLLPKGLDYVLRGNLPTALPGSAYRLLGLTDHGYIQLATIGRRIKATAFRLPTTVTKLVLARSSAATSQPIASQPVPLLSTGVKPRHQPAGAGAATTPSAPPPVTAPAPLLTLPTLPGRPGLLHR